MDSVEILRFDSWIRAESLQFHSEPGEFFIREKISDFSSKDGRTLERHIRRLEALRQCPTTIDVKCIIGLWELLLGEA